MHCNGATLTKGRVAREMIGTIETKRGDGELHIRALCSKHEKSPKSENSEAAKSSSDCVSSSHTDTLIDTT